MIKIENVEVVGMEHAIRGMRNPMNSWEKSNSVSCFPGEACSVCEDRHTGRCINGFIIGENDMTLMKKLANGGPVHAKYRRMIAVYLDIVAPSYWWKEFDTYKVGTVANSTSTMHKIHAKEFTRDDFSCEHLMGWEEAKENCCFVGDMIGCGDYLFSPNGVMDEIIIPMLNRCREAYLRADERLKTDKTLTEAERKHIESQRKYFWWQMIQLLPFSYHYRRTIMLNYEVLTGIYESRKNHKLDEWREFCKWIEQLPYSEIITGERAGEEA